MVPIVALWRAHEMATSGALRLSFNGEMLLSYASDGQAVVRLLSGWGAASASATASATASEPMPDETARSVPDSVGIYRVHVQYLHSIWRMFECKYSYFDHQLEECDVCCVQTSSVASSNTICVKCADHLKRGVRRATVSRDGSHLLVCGYDAFLYCYKWRHAFSYCTE